jgi:tetratricopeptide (TPR) repeat protein
MSEAMSGTQNRAEELRMAAYALVGSGHYEEALGIYDEALGAANDDAIRELITINKADVLVALERNGPEVQALPAILMRRRNPHHTFLAAYALLYKHRTAGETKRAMFYGHHAYDTAVEAEQPFWQIAALNELGVVYEIDSQFTEAIEYFDKALALMAAVTDPSIHAASRIAVVANLGYNKLLIGNTAEGLALLHSVVDLIEAPAAKSDALIDLCYGYLDLEEYEKARQYGEAGLELASETRQIRNAHYLLGEACYKGGDTDAAEFHFEELARFYPQFRNLKNLLYAIDLRSMLNLRL